MSFVTHAQNLDASAFKTQVEEVLAGKVVQVLEGLKAVVAQQFFNEEGGVSGGVSSVKKKPEAAAGSTKLPGPGKEGGLTHAGRSNSSDGEKSGEAKLPGVAEGKTSGEPNPKGDRVKAVEKDKKPKLPSKRKSFYTNTYSNGKFKFKKEETENSFKEEFDALNTKLEEATIKPGSEDHMMHHVHIVHTGDHGINRGESHGGNSVSMGRGHFESQHYHIHHSGVEMSDPASPFGDKHTYHVVHKGSGKVHKFEVSNKKGGAGGHSIVHQGTM
jgi:hypothetical protein